jgi:hypothetical protein
MTTIVIKPKSKSEENLLTRLFKKMNIEVQIFEEPIPDYETNKAIEDVHNRKGSKLHDKDQLNGTDWGKLSKTQKQGIIDAIDEIDSGKGIQGITVMDKFRKKYSHA